MKKIKLRRGIKKTSKSTKTVAPRRRLMMSPRSGLPRILKKGTPKMMDAEIVSGIMNSANMSSKDKVIRLIKDSNFLDVPLEHAFGGGIKGKLGAAIVKGGLTKIAQSVNYNSDDPTAMSYDTTSVGVTKLSHGSASVENSTEKVVKFARTALKNAFLKTAKNAYGESNKFFTYLSSAADRYSYSVGVNYRGWYSPFGNFPYYAGGVSYNAYWTSLTGYGNAPQSWYLATGSTTSTEAQDRKYPLALTVADYITSTLQCFNVAPPQLTSLGDCYDALLPMQSFHMSFKIFNGNTFLSSKYKIFRLSAKTDILASSQTPVECIFNVNAASTGALPASISKIVTGTGIAPAFGALTATTYNYYYNANMDVSPGLSKRFSDFYDIEEVREVQLDAGQALKVEFDMQFGKGTSLLEIENDLNRGCVVRKGAPVFMISVQGTAPVLVVKTKANATTPVTYSPDYSFIADSGFHTFRVTEVKKWFTANLPRWGSLPSFDPLTKMYNKSIVLDYSNELVVPSQQLTDPTSGVGYYVPIISQDSVVTTKPLT